MRAMTAKAARNRRSKTSVSLTLAAVATHATGAALGAVGAVGSGEIPCALGAHRATIQDQVEMAPQHANQQGVHLGQQADPGPACEPSPQGRAARLSRCRDEAAPRRARAQEPPQRRQHPDCVGRWGAATARPGWIADLDHGCNPAQDPDVQGSRPISGTPEIEIGSIGLSVTAQSALVVKSASKAEPCRGVSCPA